MKTNNPFKTKHLPSPLVNSIAVALLILLAMTASAQKIVKTQPYILFGEDKYKDTSTVLFGLGTATPLTRFHVVGDNTYSAFFMNGNVGVGTTMPGYTLDVNGTIRSSMLSGGSGLVQYDSNGALLQLPYSQSVQDVLRGDGTWGSYSDGHWQLSGNDLYSIPSGNVGIGTIPAFNYKLDILGNVHVGGSLFADDMLVSGLIKGSRIETDTVSTGKMLVDTSIRVANSIIIDGTYDRIYSTSGNIDFMSTNLSTTGTITAGGLDVDYTVFDSLLVQDILRIGSTISINGNTNEIMSNTNKITMRGIGWPANPQSTTFSLRYYNVPPQALPVVTAEWDLITDNSNKLFFTNSITNKTVMTLTDTGNVGIGTVSPSQKLEVAGNIQLTDHLVFNSTEYQHGVINWPESGNLWFRSNSTPGDILSYTDRMIIHGATGNVGIGTTFPGERLQVSRGNILVKGTNNFQSDGDEAILFLGDNNHSIKSIFGAGLRISTYQAQNAITILEGSGNVGIGTTTPDYRLDVCGTIRSHEWIVVTFGCDFVFDSKYPLMALKERKKLVLQNKHLFYVQPAIEMQEKGAEMGATVMGLLQNVEEHELYLYQLDERDDGLEKRIEELEKREKEKAKEIEQLKREKQDLQQRVMKLESE